MEIPLVPPPSRAALVCRRARGGGICRSLEAPSPLLSALTQCAERVTPALARLSRELRRQGSLGRHMFLAKCCERGDQCRA